MFFSFSTTLARFQSYISKILAKKLEIFIIFYLDDIYVYIKNSYKLHFYEVSFIFKKVTRYSLFANFRNCQFHKQKICFSKSVLTAEIIIIKDEII